jgi:Zn-dependent peptidase ImmA (M78 family)
MIEYHKAFDLLRGYLEQRGIYLAKGNFDAYMHEDKTVVYNFRLRNKENMIFSILHEIGHHLAFMNRKTYKNKFPVLFKHRWGNAKTSHPRRV